MPGYGIFASKYVMKLENLFDLTIASRFRRITKPEAHGFGAVRVFAVN
jgi:hypothetical protein